MAPGFPCSRFAACGKASAHGVPVLAALLLPLYPPTLISAESCAATALRGR
jgi:hypothetical protein